MDKDVRNMKRLCGMLHDLKRSGLYYNLMLEVHDVNEFIDTAERVYHDMKDKNAKI